MVNLTDFSYRPPRGLKPGEILETGRHRFRYVPTPHLPHGWDAGVLFEEADRILLCSDLLHQIGDLEPHGWQSGSRLVEKGVPLAQVRDLLGHASITTTERYDNQKLENLQVAAGKLESGKSFDSSDTSASMTRTKFQDSFKKRRKSPRLDQQKVGVETEPNAESDNDLENWLEGREPFSRDQETPTNIGIFRSNQTGSAICHLPLVATVFVCSPLFSDIADAMSLKMSLTRACRQTVKSNLLHLRLQ